jgi:hypothetical protein
VKYGLDLMCVQEVSWNKGGTECAEGCIFMEKELKIVNHGQDFLYIRELWGQPHSNTSPLFCPGYHLLSQLSFLCPNTHPYADPDYRRLTIMAPLVLPTLSPLHIRATLPLA